MLTLSSDLDTICNIVQDVVPNLEENGGRVNGNELDLRMMIHQSQAGCVIGKAGYKIKELREKTGARIKIFSNLAPQSTDRIIQIVGEPTKCIDSIREIITLIKSNPIKGIVNPYDPHNYDDYYAEEYGGWGSAGNERRGGGGGGGGGGANAGNGGPRGNRNGFRDGPPPGRFSSRGPPAQRGAAPSMNFNDRSSVTVPQRRDYNGNGPTNGTPRPAPFESNVWGTPASTTPVGNHPPASMMSNGLNQPPMPPQNGGAVGAKTTTQVTIPKDLAGAIIGKGGGRIRKVRQDSGAGITIDEPLPGSNDRIITITGTPNQIQMAQYLLQQSVHNNSDRNSY
ncbi:heterogeneous nuclear ribonucleoprotein K isoform X2 [Zophobas morio]